MTPVSVGTRVGPYEIVAPLGAGGMGEVWRGRDTRLDRSVAIKILPADFAQDAQLKLRFEREARAISQLNHPNICTLYDVGDSYLVMELLEGESLADRLSRGPLPIQDVLRYGAQVADALDKAHRAGIVHRDLKPGNVMITKTGAKLLDFGLAKSTAAVIGGDGATQHKPLTQEGTILGTFQYMAPEQLEGEEADARTDIFALGALLYEMVTGTRAFAGKTRTSLIAAIVSGEPKPIAAIQPLTPPAFEHVVQKCLEKNPDDRWQSAHDVAEELRWAAVVAPAAAQRRSSGWLAWAVVAVLAVVAGAFAYRVARPPEPRPHYQFTIPMIDGDSYKFGGAPQLSPDGRTLFFRASTANTVMIFRRPLGDLTAKPIEGTEGANSFLVTPDGKNLIIVFAGAVIKRISVNGGPLETLTESAIGGGLGATVAPDGTTLVSIGFAPIRRLKPNGDLEPVTHLETARGEIAHEAPLFLADGKRFLFLSVTRDPNRDALRRTLCAGKLGSNEVTRIGDVPTRVQLAVGHLFFVRQGTLMAQPFDESRLAFTGDAFPIADNVSFNARSGFAAFSVARDGTIACLANGLGVKLTWMDRTGKKLGTIADIDNAGRGGVAVLPGGNQIVIALADVRAGIISLWIRGLTRDTATRVTFSTANEVAPVVSPDGSRIFFANDSDGAFHVYEAPLDGSTPPRLLVAAANVQVPTDISPDGRFLLFQNNQNQAQTKQDLWILPLTGNAKPYPFVATPAIEVAGKFSPDGKWIAYQASSDGTQVYVKPFPGPGPARVVSTKGGSSPSFSRDGRKIYFTNRGNLMSADFGADGSIGEPVPVFHLDDRVIGIREIGDRFLVLLENEAEASPPVRIITGWQPPA